MHVVQIFSDANLFAGMASDLNTTPPPDLISTAWELFQNVFII